MSSWTHVNFVAEVSTSMEPSRQGLKDQVEAILDYLPRVTGSEGDAEIYVNIPQAPSATVGQRRYWGTAYITMMGHLRDNTKIQTEQEIKCFVSALKRHYSTVRNITYKVYRDGEELDYCGGDDAKN